MVPSCCGCRPTPVLQKWGGPPSGPFNGVHDPLRCGEPDGNGQESEFADDDGHPLAADAAFSGQDGFVRAGLLAGRGQLLPVNRGWDRDLPRGSRRRSLLPSYARAGSRASCAPGPRAPCQ